MCKKCSKIWGPDNLSNGRQGRWVKILFSVADNSVSNRCNPLINVLHIMIICDEFKIWFFLVFRKVYISSKGFFFSLNIDCYNETRKVKCLVVSIKSMSNITKNSKHCFTILWKINCPKKLKRLLQIGLFGNSKYYYYYFKTLFY